MTIALAFIGTVAVAFFFGWLFSSDDDGTKPEKEKAE